MIQGGDPLGRGTGGPGYSIRGEFARNGFNNPLKHTRGVLSMAVSYTHLDVYKRQLLTIVTLYIMGVDSIKQFALPLIIGIVAGTYSANLINGYVWAALMDKRDASKRAKAKA